MPETKFTPGPWRADWDDNGQWYVEPLQVTGPYLRGDAGDCVESANAHLIAAAPDLYAALEHAASALELGHPLLADRRLWPDACLTPSIQTCNCALATEYKLVLAALAKARGES